MAQLLPGPRAGNLDIGQTPSPGGSHPSSVCLWLLLASGLCLPPGSRLCPDCSPGFGPCSKPCSQPGHHSILKTLTVTTPPLTEDDPWLACPGPSQLGPAGDPPVREQLSRAVPSAWHPSSPGLQDQPFQENLLQGFETFLPPQTVSSLGVAWAPFLLDLSGQDSIHICGPAGEQLGHGCCRANSPMGKEPGLQVAGMVALESLQQAGPPRPRRARPRHPRPWAGGGGALVTCPVLWSPTPCLINAWSGRLLLCSISSPTFFMSNPPRRSPEGFEVSGRTNKDVTLAHAALLNEDGFDVEAVGLEGSGFPAHPLSAAGRPGLPAAGRRGWRAQI